MQLYYKKPDFFSGLYGSLYYVDHPCYNRCTLFKIKDRGIAVVQQRFEPETKKTWWDAIDPWLADDIYLNRNFMGYFDLYAEPEKVDGTYKTVSVRQIMHSLRMRPLEKQPWETRF